MGRESKKIDACPPRNMAEVSMEDRIYRHEAKPQPTENPPGMIVEAFGLGKCEKFVQQVRDELLLVRVNALRVLCDEFKNPATIAGCAKAGLMSTLPEMVLDADLDTRKYSSKAIGYAARDYNGRTALLQESAPATLFPALDDDSVDVRRNVYEALANASTTGPGTRALVGAGYSAKLVDKAVEEAPELQPLALLVLRNVIRNKEGLQEALRASLVEALISLLSEEKPPEVLRGASRTLGLACFDDTAKIIAIHNDGVSMLAGLMASPACGVRSATMGALMMITTVDAGKRAISSTSAAEEVVKALRSEEPDDVLILNALKLTASIAVHPDIRVELKENEACLSTIRALEENADPIVAHHAAIALEAVLWEP